jgi:type II secretory pathway component GspD/PulD (secretin)
MRRKTKMVDEPKAKDKWDKWHIVANSIAILLVPILVAYFGNQINTAIKDREISQKYVELAIGLLKVAPDSQSPALREWAINIVNANSSVRINEKVREELKHKPLRPARVVLSAHVKGISSTSSAKLSANGNSNILTDEKGNAITDEKGNVLIIEGEPATMDNKPITVDSKPTKR